MLVSHISLSELSVGAFVREGGGNGAMLSSLLNFHKRNRQLMIAQFGKPLTVAIVGAGPIGLAGALSWYRLGATVHLYEKYLEKPIQGHALRSFMERNQPFSLINLSYLHLASLGLLRSDILAAFGLNHTEWEAEIDKNQSAQVAGFTLLASPLMARVRKKQLGSDFEYYLPSQTSLPIKTMQELLYTVIKNVQNADHNSIFMHFGYECIDKSIDDMGRIRLLFKDKAHSEVADIIYNCSGGGACNQLLGFKKSPGVKMFGVGAFFPKPNAPIPASGKKPILSRCIRVFTDYRSNWVYINTEISEKDYLNSDPAPIHNLLDTFSQQTGLDSTRKFFKVKVELSPAEEVIKSNHRSSFKNGLQLIINGGDAAIPPDFRTASGANIGTLGQLAMVQLFEQCLQGQDINFFYHKYTHFTKLLSKQTHQTVLNLFGRPHNFDR